LGRIAAQALYDLVQFDLERLVRNALHVFYRVVYISSNCSGQGVAANIAYEWFIISVHCTSGWTNNQAIQEAA